jgi:hypothetical protein
MEILIAELYITASEVALTERNSLKDNLYDVQH